MEKRKTSLLAWLLTVPLCLLFLLPASPWVQSRISHFGVHVPVDAEVKQMTVRLNPEHKIPEFTVPPEHVSIILLSMQPFEKDYDPYAWFSLGDLFITTTDDRIIQINLYEKNDGPGDGPGAFCITGTHGRAYFRGGTTKGLIQAIRHAYVASVQ